MDTNLGGRFSTFNSTGRFRVFRFVICTNFVGIDVSPDCIYVLSDKHKELIRIDPAFLQCVTQITNRFVQFSLVRCLKERTICR
jgi:hypothetical protein